jgi:aspartate carbamoyltransferase catalytic subunit
VTNGLAVRMAVLYLVAQAGIEQSHDPRKR